MVVQRSLVGDTYGVDIDALKRELNDEVKDIARAIRINLVTLDEPLKAIKRIEDRVSDLNDKFEMLLARLPSEENIEV
jgi:hypothetical protein